MHLRSLKRDHDEARAPSVACRRIAELHGFRSISPVMKTPKRQKLRDLVVDIIEAGISINLKLMGKG